MRSRKCISLDEVGPLIDQSSSQPLVHGKIVFDNALPFSGATLYVLLEDTTLADADSVTVQRLVKSNIAYDPHTDANLSFELHGELPDKRALYSISVLVDLDGDGKVSRGDYITTQSYPVLTRGHPSDVSVRVKRVE